MIKNRIRELREARGLSQADLGKLVEATGTSVSRYEKEDSRINLPLLDKLASALRVRQVDLIAESEIPDLAKIQVRGQERSIYLDGHEASRLGDLAALEAIYAPDDSMAPTISRGDLVIIDTTVQSVVADGVYAFAAGEGVIVKRASGNPLRGTVTISSDNPVSPGLGDMQRDEIRTAGIVVMVQRRM
jgi:transcriptional regulator with XRE-family HTH domain